MTGQVTARDVIALPMLEDSVLVGDPASLDRPVDDVDQLVPAEVMSASMRERSIVLLAVEERDGRWEHLIELLIRRAAGAGAVAVLVPHPADEPSTSLARVALRFDIPVVLYDPRCSARNLTVDARVLVREPEMVEARLLMQVAGDPSGGARTAEGVVAALADLLRCEANIVSARHARTRLNTSLAELSEIREPRSWVDGGRTVAAMRIGAGTDEPTWVVAERTDAPARWGPLARRALALVRGDLLVWLTGERLEAERRARTRSMLLNELTERGAATSPDVLRAAQDTGWRLRGWHTGFHLSITGGPPLEQWAVEAVAANTGGHGLDGVIERSDGWVMWLTDESPPPPDTLRETIRTLRDQLDRLRDDAVQRRVAVGVGSPQRDAAGLATTLEQAREAALTVPSTQRRVAIRAVQDLGASQLLLGWYGSGVFREVSRQILDPLAGPEEEVVLSTLEAYLERACSAAQTARVLGVHRNTVTQRLTRAERLLGVSLSQPDTRLALQLALRGRRHD
ncbi:MAG: PucR family transcriptional regulator [Nocardioidaceae bacterium]